MHSDLYVGTNDSAQLNFHSVQRFPYVGHLYNLGGFEWEAKTDFPVRINCRKHD